MAKSRKEKTRQSFNFRNNKIRKGEILMIPSLT